MLNNKTKVIGVYQIRNIINDKRYIGSSDDVVYRLRAHLSELINDAHRYNNGRRSKLQSAWNKYGASNFEQSIISEHQSIEEARCIEQWWLDYYHTYNKRWNELYNTAKYVYMPMSGRKHTTDAIKKISEASKRMHSDPEFKEKHRKALKNAMSKPETKKKLSDIGKIVQNRDDVNIKRSTSLKKAYSSEEVRKNHGKIIKEALAKPEAKRHQQAAMKKLWDSEEFREKMNKVNCSIETKTRRSNAAKEVNKRPEYKEKQRLANANPEVKLRRSVAQKEARNRPEVRQKFLGSNNKSAKLNDSQVCEIKQYVEQFRELKGRCQRLLDKLSIIYCVGPGAIRDILTFRTWKHIEVPLTQKKFII